jgi:hypothetical protein
VVTLERIRLRLIRENNVDAFFTYLIDTRNGFQHGYYHSVIGAMIMIRKLMFGVVLSILAALNSISVASADQPVFSGPYSFPGSFVVADCGTFQVVDNFTLVFTIKQFFEHDSDAVRAIFDVNSTDTFTNSATGKAFTDKSHYVVIADGEATLTYVALTFKLTVPARGAVFQAVGRIVHDAATGQVLFQAGQWDQMSGDTRALCAALE